MAWPGPARPGNPRGHLTLSGRSSLRVKQFQRASLLEYEAPNLQVSHLQNGHEGAKQAGTGRSNQSAESHSSLSDDNDKQSNTSSQKRSSSQSSALSRGLAEAHCHHNLFSPLGKALPSSETTPILRNSPLGRRFSQEENHRRKKRPWFERKERRKQVEALKMAPWCFLHHESDAVLKQSNCCQLNTGCPAALATFQCHNEEKIKRQQKMKSRNNDNLITI